MLVTNGTRLGWRSFLSFRQAIRFVKILLDIYLSMFRSQEFYSGWHYKPLFSPTSPTSSRVKPSLPMPVFSPNASTIFDTFLYPIFPDYSAPCPLKTSSLRPLTPSLNASPFILPSPCSGPFFSRFSTPAWLVRAYPANGSIGCKEVRGRAMMPMKAM